MPALEREPVLAVCGWSGSGKTTLLEGVLPALIGRGLRVAVVKHDAHGLDIDREGKDSDRFFRAGADVWIQSPDECVSRRHREAGEQLIAATLHLLGDHDLVLIEGYKHTPLPKIWCTGPDGADPPAEAGDLRAVLPWLSDREGRLLAEIDVVLSDAVRQRPVLGGLLMGGRSRRMGSPKHLVEIDGATMAERVAAVLEDRVDGVVLLGAGDVPDRLAGADQVPDAPGLGGGPLAGLVTAFRWAPRSAWLMVACDMPGLQERALEWLLSRRAPGRWAVVPQDAEGRLEPLFALYEPQAAALLEDLVAEGRRAPRRVAEHSKVFCPELPPDLAAAVLNLNRPEDVESYLAQKRP